MSGDAHRLLFPSLPYDARPRATAALGDARLQAALSAATWSKDDARRAALGAAFGPRADGLRRLAGQVKRHTLAHLDHYLARFIAHAQAAGIVVHAAADAAEARQRVVAIAAAAGVTRCVKTKSMVTEEIALVPALEAAGIPTVETDLGEYVLQLDGDAPSHIVTPMIHKTRHDAARAFDAAMPHRAPVAPEPEALTKAARSELRAAFRAADLGVSGGNFLVADEGALVLCTNEGNGRFVTASPRVHVAVVGIEKVVPDFASLGLMLELLAKSSTGQPLTVYTSILSRPQGEALHIILLDNRRSAVLADPTFRDVLGCIRCGACLNTCPVYRTIGGHAYGSVYPGPVGAVLTPLMRGVDSYGDLPHLTTLCGACQQACPVDIPLPAMLVALRGRQRRSLRKRVAFRLAASGLSSRLGTRLLARAVRRAGKGPPAGAPRPIRFRAWLAARRRRARKSGGDRDDP